jgi:hypothetical protein
LYYILYREEMGYKEKLVVREDFGFGGFKPLGDEKTKIYTR